MCRESGSFPAFFTPRTDRPLVIDCGANIGVTVLDWKHRWPGAEVICFEPDPHAFRLLQMTIDRNDIPSVRCINAAVGDTAGQVTLYGDISAGGDARGNSIERGWGWRPDSHEHQVPCVTLSDFIADRRVDFLKLDVEGVEERVLTQIADQLGQIDAIYVEVHETDGMIDRNAAERITDLLQRAGFHVQAEHRDPSCSLPASQRQWQRRVGARQTQLLCWR